MRLVNCAYCLILALGGFTAPTHADSLPPARQREILRTALHAYDQAVAVARQNPTQAAKLYSEAAAGFNALIDAGVHNPALEYNLGNVHFRLGELGRAILHYRRAIRLATANAPLQANLHYARSRVEPQISPTGGSRLTHALFFWHYRTSLHQRQNALSILTAIGWSLLLIWLWRRRSGWLLAGLIVVTTALATGASLRWQLLDEAARPPAVVIDAPHPLRLGRGEGSDLALKQPLGPGVEVRILERRGDWVEVRLANQQTGWLPADAVEPVNAPWRPPNN